MAGNYGKFIDRSPIICAAGKLSGDPTENVGSCLMQYKLVDEINALKHDAKIWTKEEEEEVFVPPRNLPPIQNAAFRGTNTEIRELLNPPAKTRYQQLIQDLKETPYLTYWNAQIGKVQDSVPGLPIGMNPIETTFGDPSKKDISVKELVNPSKSHYQVLRESQVAHEMYKKTHNDYNPSEKINRNYKTPPFNPNKCYGEKSKYDPRGIWVKCACDWFQKEPLHYANKLQADYQLRTRPQLGKVLAPNNNIKLVPNGHAFGDASKRDFYELSDLLKDPNVKPCVFKKNFQDWFASLNKLRQLLKDRRNKGLMKIEDLYKTALYLDKEKSGFLSINELYELCACNNISIPSDLECLCHYFNYIVNGKINYKAFFAMLDINANPLDILPIDDIPQESKYYVTTTQAASCDYLIINNNELPAAGIPSIRHDLPRPIVPSGGTRADLENLGNDTTAKAVVSPSIYTNYGLTYRDFFLPRSANTIRNTFEKLGYNFPGQNFEKLWEMGLQHDQTGGVCVDTFKMLLQTRCPSLKLRIDEKQIECDKAINNNYNNN